MGQQIPQMEMPNDWFHAIPPDGGFGKSQDLNVRKTFITLHIQSHNHIQIFMSIADNSNLSVFLLLGRGRPASARDFQIGQVHHLFQ
jgi:hypothetical protein